MLNLFSQTKLTFVFLLILVHLTSAENEKFNLIEQSLLNGQLMIQIPAHFQPMSEDMLKLKYPNQNRPTLVYTDEKGTVNVAMNLTQNAITPTQIPQFHQAMEKMFKNLYPSAKWYQSTILEQDQRKYFILDLETPAIDTKIHNMIMGTSLNGKLLIISFNVTQELEKTWIETGRKILQTMKLAKDSTPLTHNQP